MTVYEHRLPRSLKFEFPPKRPQLEIGFERAGSGKRCRTSATGGHGNTRKGRRHPERSARVGQVSQSTQLEIGFERAGSG